MQFSRGLQKQNTVDESKTETFGLNFETDTETFDFLSI